MKNKFYCPLPWNSLSFGPETRLRTCCHQTTDGEKVEPHTDPLTLDHNKKIRSEIESGKIPSECSYCYKLEENEQTSPRLQYIQSFGIKNFVAIEYLDLTIDNACNLACMMCSPFYSTKLNAFYTKINKGLAETNWKNEYINNYLIDILPKLKKITLTGGEPLISRNAIEFLEKVSLSPFAKNIELKLFTNLSVVNFPLLKSLRHFKSVEYILSIDSVGANYEEIRKGASFEVVKKNVETLKSEIRKCDRIFIHSVIMASNWNYLTDLFEFHNSLGLENGLSFPILIEIENPNYLHPTVLPKNQFNLGLEKIISYLSNCTNIKEVSRVKTLINNIQKKNFENLYLTYTLFTNKHNKEFN